MKNDLNNQLSTSRTDENVALQAEVDSGLPLSASVLTKSGSGSSYSFQVAGESNTDQDIENEWNSVKDSGEYSIFSFFWVEFNQGLPAGTNWVLSNAAGVTVASGNTGRGTSIRLNFHLRPFSDGTPSIQAQNTYHLSLSRSFTNFASFTVPNTSGGLVIIANVDGQDDYYDASQVAQAATELQQAEK